MANKLNLGRHFSFLLTLSKQGFWVVNYASFSDKSLIAIISQEASLGTNLNFEQCAELEIAEWCLPLSQVVSHIVRTKLCEGLMVIASSLIIGHAGRRVVR